MWVLPLFRANVIGTNSIAVAPLASVHVLPQIVIFFDASL